ncbi:putative surface protein with fasciclin (FAS1) repeats [Mucilaginibacter yixingensis]|uniref:Putative surface protein with fasciclin (FAS1) repeats n=1 Tax=Mucilaginibacter yixingensis TaxID=1295612 RepID=A0A2T5JBL0_9SPHI|nr:fasciclin domain-containing protein [Mucilaginibacter yixingensis]PTQ98250.1 putative surface protein with fasciclin (FAS1) repeats [Mucilaginibacter yixingensis]
MRTIFFKRISMWLSALPVLFAILFSGCAREHINYNTTSVVNMYSYLEQDPANFSMFKQIIDKAGYGDFLNSYGTYTLFASTNDGVKAFLKANNLANIDAIDQAMAKKIVSISLIADTINTSLFTDGKMRTPTTSGQFLITGAQNTDGASSITINRQANLIKGNVRLGNGIVHVIDNVLMPAQLTLAKMIEQNPSYSIFSDALKATGFYDTLNVASADQTNPARKYLTLIAETNTVFAAAGISDFNTLKAKYSTTGNPKDPTDSLYLFVAYHILPELSFMSDIVAVSSHPTLAPLEVTTSMLQGEDVLLNNDTFNGVLEPGVALVRSLSDFPAQNGVLHSAAANYKIKVREPSAVYFDFGDQPEIRRAPGVFRVLGLPAAGIAFSIGDLADVTWVSRASSDQKLYYCTTGVVPGSGDYYYGNDFVYFGTRFQPGSGGGIAMMEITFKTPLLVRGRYKVWIDWRRVGGTAPIVVSFDGADLPTTFTPNDVVSDKDNDAVLESKGFKRYSESPLTSNSNGFVSKMVGVINVTTTDRHFIKFRPTGSIATQIPMDAVEFRPIDMQSQITPKLGRDGSLKY